MTDPPTDAGAAASHTVAASDTTCHVSVLPTEVLEWLAPRAGEIWVDGTLGGAGHARLLAQRVLPGGELLAFDRDPQALHRAERTLAGFPVRLVHASFDELPQVLQQLEVPVIDGVLLDLGLSSDQLADAERGFSFQAEGPLDLRFDPTTGRSAADLVARLGERELADLIYRFGEERHSRRIARRIVERRREKPIVTARDLAELVRGCVPREPATHRGPRRSPRIDTATRTFQALRIAVNDELGSLERVLTVLPDWVRVGGRVGIISFHSLEDRLVKHAFRDNNRWEPLTRKPIEASEAEIAANPRARSARLRVARRVDPAP